jgi:fructose-specific phosphotransferase system IIC component
MITMISISEMTLGDLILWFVALIISSFVGAYFMHTVIDHGILSEYADSIYHIIFIFALTISIKNVIYYVFRITQPGLRN